MNDIGGQHYYQLTRELEHVLEGVALKLGIDRGKALTVAIEVLNQVMKGKIVKYDGKDILLKDHCDE